MRSFPRTPSRRVPSPGRRGASSLVSGLLAVGLTTGLTTGLTAALDPAQADDLKDKQQQVKRQLRDAKTELDEASDRARRTAQALADAQERLSAARGELAAARGRLTAAKLRDQEMQAALEAAVARLAQARLALDSGRQAVDDKRGDAQSMIVDFYTGGDPRLTSLTQLLDSQTPSDLVAAMEAREVLVSTQADAYDELRAAEVLLTVREDEVEDAKQETAQRRREAARQLEETRAAEAAAQQAATAVAGHVSASREARGQALAARRADLRMLRALKAEDDRIARLLARRAAAASSPSGPTGGYLSYPTSGPVTSPFGYRTHPIYHYWGLHDGTDFGAACGAPLRAAAPGRVLSSYWSDVYGNRLIVDYGLVRGVGLASIYNHATNYTVSVGQRVTRGQIIGYVGSTGWSTGCHLHFTVMVNGRAVDPMNWL